MTIVSRFTAWFDRDSIWKLVRYSAVSIVVLPLGQIALNLAVGVWHLPVLLANFLVATVFTPVLYLINKYWVWRHTDRAHVAREATIFWCSAVLSVLFTTFTLWVGTSAVDTSGNAVVRAIVFLVAAVIGAGLVWIARFIVLDRFVFTTPVAELALATEDP
jgi:putative flippase GtrA